MATNDEQDLLARVPSTLYIDGRWRAAAGTFDVVDPATGETLKEVADATPADGEAAVDAAARAFEPWAATPARVRADLLRAVFDLLNERAEAYALLKIGRAHV